MERHDPAQIKERAYSEVLGELMGITLGKEYAHRRRSLIVEAGRVVQNTVSVDVRGVYLPVDGSSVVTDTSSSNILADN